MITPKPFQQIYVDNVLLLFRSAKALYDGSTSDFDHRRVFSHNGAVLLKAPTGSGKTIMAGTIAEQFAAEEKVVWFWFAPYKGLVNQSAMSLRDHHPGLNVRELASDRDAGRTKSGDTFVVTWASVVARTADARKIRTGGESIASLDALLADLREAGFRIGVVIDEAHHTLKSKNVAMTFFREILIPDYCLMITATPDDSDAENFRRDAKIKELHRVTVSREEVVEAGLIKPSVYSIAYVNPPDQALQADFEAAALADGCRMHEQIKGELSREGIDLVPLMMIQAGTDENIEQTRRALTKLGLPESKVCVYTSKEPDEDFKSLAVNEEFEVLIFKVAAALGFDAPRAFCMVSMRSIKDTDFGTQLIGRIMRVHGKLQGRKLPPLLQNGYLFLSDVASQDGISSAADKINKLKSQLAQTSPFLMLTKVGGVPQVQLIRNNQPNLLPPPECPSKVTGSEEEDEGEEPNSFGGVVIPDEPSRSQALIDLLGDLTRKEESKQPEQDEETPAEPHVYKLKDGSPLRFITQELPLEVNDLLTCIEQQVGFNDSDLLKALAKEVQIIRIEKAHFTDLKEDEGTQSYLTALIDIEKTGLQAQQLLLRQQYMSAKDLQDHLLKRLAKEFRDHGHSEVADDEERLEAALNSILVNNPKLLHEVEKTCAARFAYTRRTAPIPGFVTSQEPLRASFKNIYGVFPSDMNPWEVEFAKLLDNDTTGTSLWWHRNPPRKDYSVCIVRPDGGRFFPDFIVGVKGRNRTGNILLVETKHAIGSVDSQIKATVEHKEYGKALMIHWKDWNDEKRREAMTVTFDPQTGKNVLDSIFKCSSMPTY